MQLMESGTKTTHSLVDEPLNRDWQGTEIGILTVAAVTACGPVKIFMKIFMKIFTSHENFHEDLHGTASESNSLPRGP